MTTYSIFHCEPYEGKSVVFVGTLEECTAWVKDRSRGYSLNDCDLYSNDAPDIFSLLNE